MPLSASRWNTAFFAVFCLLLAVPAMAADELSPGGPTPSFQLNLGATPRREAKDGSGDYRDLLLGGSADIPFYVRRSAGEGKISYLRFSAAPAFEVVDEDLSSLGIDRKFYQGRLDVQGAAFTKDREFYLLRLGAGGVTEEGSGRYRPRLNLIGMGTRHAPSGVTYIYGLSYSYVFGRGLLFPVFGMRWQLSDRWGCSTILPVLVRFQYKASPACSFTFFSTVHGNHLDFENEGRYPGRGDELALRMTALKLGTGADLTLTRNWSMSGELALLALRKVTVTEGSEEIDNDWIREGLTFRLGLNYKFSGDRKAGEVTGSRQ